MSRKSVNEIFSHDGPDSELDVDSPVEEYVLAIDQIDRWGAAFIFSVDETGEWYAECLRAQRRTDGHWIEMCSSGTHGSEWPIPWAPPPERWTGGEPLLVLVSGGQSVDTATAEDQMLQAVVGFADPSVESIRLAQGELRRQVKVRSRQGAFVVMLSLGVGPIELQAFNSTETKVGSARQIVDPGHDPARGDRAFTLRFRK
jgi:hypothetical protein